MTGFFVMLSTHQAWNVDGGHSVNTLKSTFALTSILLPDTYILRGDVFMTFLKVLRLRHIAFLWLSQVLSAMGDYFYQMAVMWIAVKSVGSEAGIVAAAEAGSMLIFGLLGGVYADRWNRRTVMISVDIVRAGAVATLPLLAHFGVLQFWHLVV